MNGNEVYDSFSKSTKASPGEHESQSTGNSDWPAWVTQFWELPGEKSKVAYLIEVVNKKPSHLGSRAIFGASYNAWSRFALR